MKPVSNEIRGAFIAQMQAWQKSRHQINDINRNWTDREKAIYDAGFQDGVGCVIASTDSRELNGATFRIVDLNGDFVPFYDGDRPEYGGVTEEEMSSHPGLIVAIFPH